MTTTDILTLRLQQQALHTPNYAGAVDVVRALTAVQSQDYLGAKWAIAQRTPALTSNDVDKAFNTGEILRTHVLRPTWHFVVAEDLPWMLELTAPRIRAFSATYFRKLGLTDDIFEHIHIVLKKTLRGGVYRTRTELASDLSAAGIDTSDLLGLTFMAMEAELSGVICSGPLKGKQHTYALLEERVPHPRKLSRDEALAELALRFFASHGPATLADYAWWSGLTKTDAKKGLEAVASRLQQANIDNTVYWFTGTAPMPTPSLQLLPNYDEYVVAYTDRSPFFDVRHLQHMDSRQNPLFNNVIVIDGKISGVWKRTIKTKECLVELHPFSSLDATHTSLLEQAITRYSKYIELPVTTVEK